LKEAFSPGGLADGLSEPFHRGLAGGRAGRSDPRRGKRGGHGGNPKPLTPMCGRTALSARWSWRSVRP